MSTPGTTVFSYTQTDEESRSEHGLEMSGAFTVTLASSQRTVTANQHGIATAFHNLKKKCQHLKKYASYSKTELPEDIFQIFVEVSELATQVGGTPQYEQFIKVTSSVFADVESGRGDTIADFFIGCSRARPSPGSSVGCEAVCAGNLPMIGYGTEDFCSHHVAVHSGSLSITYSPADKTNTIRIYHAKPDVVLSSSEVESLHKKGITKAILTYTGGSIQVSSPITPVASLSVKGKKALRGGKLTVPSSKTASSRKSGDTKSCKSKDEGGNGYWIIAAIIFFIVIILIIYLAVACCGGGSTIDNSGKLGYGTTTTPGSYPAYGY